MTNRSLRNGAALLVAGAVFLAFKPALSNGFVSWDDHEYYLSNHFYRGLGWANLKWMFGTALMGIYQPLSWVTLGFDYLVWGMNPFGYHLTSLLFHAANSALFFFVCLRLFALAKPRNEGEDAWRIACAAFAALLFGAHPLRVESVAWISERRDVLSGFFYLGTMLLYLYGRRRAAVGVFTLSLLSKGMAVSLPAALIALDFYPLRRLPLELNRWTAREFRGVWLEKLWFALPALAIAAIGLKEQSIGRMPYEGLGIFPRTAQACFSAAFYLVKSVWPLGLSPLYERPLMLDLLEPRFLASIAFVAAVTAAAWARRSTRPAFWTAWHVYLITLLPVSGVIQAGPQLVADRYAYLPCLAWAALAGGCALALDARRRSAAGAAALGLTALLGAMTWSQTLIWRDSETLWRHALAQDSNNSVAHSNLGRELQHQGRVEEAIAHQRAALRANPFYEEAHINLCAALIGIGRFEEAAAHCREAIQLNPRLAVAHNNLGRALELLGRPEEAGRKYLDALSLDSGYPEAHSNLARLDAARGRFREAVAHYETALLRIDSAALRTNLGNALYLSGRREDSIAQFEAALALDPNNADAQINLGVVRSQLRAK